MPSEKPYDEMSDMELMDLQADAYRAIIHDDVSAQDPEYDIFDNIAVILAKRHIDRRNRLARDDLGGFSLDSLYYMMSNEFLRLRYDATAAIYDDRLYKISRIAEEIRSLFQR